MNKRKRSLVVFFFVVLFVVLISFSAVGPRIDDHFWYLADVESLINGKGVQTNNIFPTQAIRGEILQNPSFIHNVPFIYLAAIPGSFVGAYNGWILLNILASLIAAFFIYKTTRLYASSWVSIGAGLLYLFLPATVWLTSQLLIEAMVAPFVAAIMYLFLAKNQSFSSWIGIMLISVFLVLCKKNFLLLIPVIPIAYSVCNYKRHYWFARASFLILASIILLSVFVPLFSSNFSPSGPTSNNHTSVLSPKKYLRILYIGVPGKTSNMDSYYNLNPSEITTSELLENLWLKTKKSLQIQFFNSRSDNQIYYLPYNIMLLITLLGFYTACKQKQKKWILLTTASLFFAFLHIFTILVMQNQFRYLTMVIPSLIISACAFYGVHLHKNSIKRKYKLFILFLISLLIICGSIFDYYVVWKLNIQYELSRKRIDGIDFVLNEIPIDNNVIVESMKYYTLYAYKLQPRRVLYVRSTYGVDELQTMIKNVKASWVLCKDDSILISKIGLLGQPRYRLLGISSDLLIVRLPE